LQAKPPTLAPKRIMRINDIPKMNCLKCDLYNKCAKYDNGRCLKKPYVEKYRWRGLNLTAKEWSDFLEISYHAVQKQLVRNGIEGLARLAEKHNVVM
jgi:hypothetical protein